MNPYFGEFIGTFLLIFLGECIVAGAVLKGSKAEGGGWIVITAGWGLAVIIAIFSVHKISGGHLNSAVTIGLAAIGKFPWAQVPGYILAQLLGAFCGAVLTFLVYYPHWAKTDDPMLKRAVFCTSPAIQHLPSNFLSEFIGTFVLLFGVLVIISQTWADGLGVLAIGILLTLIGMALGGTTGYAINPARDLGPRIAHALLPIAGKGSAGWSYAWVPITAPVLGGITGAYAYITLIAG